MKRLPVIILLFFGQILLAQVPNDFLVPNNISAERNSRFRVSDAPDDFLEITNSTQFDNSFIPSIWGHQQSDTRFVLRLFATTTSTYDSGILPLMIFRAELRNAINQSAPTGGTFPWGNVAANVVNRPLFSWQNGNTDLMTIRANGFLGIGTTTPSALLHTFGTVRFENLPNSTVASFMLGTDSSGNVSEYPIPAGGNPDADWLRPDGSVSYSINNDIYTNGKVGINVQNPSSDFDVDGTVRLQNLPNSTSASFMLGTDSSGNVSEYPIPAGGSPDADWLRPDGSVSYSINNDIYTNGKVGIGTSIIPTSVGTEDVSSYGLFVKGGILTEEVRVAVESEWADFVFDDEYKLPTLKEVEEQIRKEKHLKDIPSAEEVKNNGIELAEMNKLLLQKVEELTLYVIELNKKVETQQAEIDIFKKEKK